MITYLRSKLWGGKWLVLCLLIGNILLVGVVSGTPIYLTATMQRIFQHDMTAFANANNTFPAVIQLRYPLNRAPRGYETEYFDRANRETLPWVINTMGVPTLETITAYMAVNWVVEHIPDRGYAEMRRTLSMIGVEGFRDHVELTHGRMPSDELVDGRIIEVIAHEFTISLLPHMMGEVMGLYERHNLYMQIVGVFTIPHESEIFWSISPFNIRTATFLVSDQLLYNRFIGNYSREYNMVAHWVGVLDPEAMHVRHIPRYLDAFEQFEAILGDADNPTWDFSQNFSRILIQTQEADTIGMTLWILQIHVFIMLGLYIYMVSRQILQLDTNDISVLRSRGASRRQILQLYVMQGIFVAAVSFPIGLLLGVGLCHVLGSSNGFMELVAREAMQVVVTREAMLFAGGALFLSFLTMFLPVIRFSRVDVVENKLTKRNKPVKPLWQRYFLDFVFFGVAIYGLYSFGNLQDLLDAALLADTPGIDPLLYLSSSLFIIGLGLICLRFYPLIMRFVFFVGRRFWSPSLYASMLKIVRSTGEEIFIMLFLIVSVSIGIYNAQVARTINLNNEHLVKYMRGADVMFREHWLPIEVGRGGPYEVTRLVWIEPDFTRFQNFEEVDSMTRVINRDGSVRGRGRTIPVERLMSIETHTFGETVWFRDDLLRIHMNYFLNALAMMPNGVLLSDNFRTQHGFVIGDTVTLFENELGDLQYQRNFVIVGFLDYWPTYAPVRRTMDPNTREIFEHQSHLAVVNLGYTSTHWGIRPYQIWMSTNTNSAQFLSDFVREYRIFVAEFHDTNAELAAVMADPLVQGTNGVLTVGFIVILVVCFFGFLIYWILSIRSRILQFGIFRAMGLGMRSIVGLLINEQLFITFTAIGIGAFVGVLGSRLFVPLIQIAYTAATQVIPILVVEFAQDYVNIFVTLGATILFCMVVLISYISKIKIDQALKLGED